MAKKHNTCYTNSGAPLPARRYFVEEFARALNATGATPVYTLNVLTSTLDDQLAFLRHARAVGALPPGSYVELGGEFYWGKFQGRYPTGADYARVAVAWAKAIADDDALAGVGVRSLAVAAHSTVAGPGTRTYEWNAQVYAALAAAPAATRPHGVVVHPYLHIASVKNAMGGSGWSKNASAQQAQVDTLRTRAGAAALLGIPFFANATASGNAATHARLPASLRMLATEYNVMDRVGPFKLTWLHAMFVGATAFNLLSAPQVDGALLHVLLNGWGWGALYETSNDFVGGKGGGKPYPGWSNTAVGGRGCLIPACGHLATAPVAPTAVGTMLATLAGAMRGASWAAPVARFAAGSDGGNPIVPNGAMPSGLPGKVAYPSLLGFAFGGHGSATASAVAILNLGDEALAFDVAGSPWFVGGDGDGDGAAWETLTSPDAGGDPVAWATAASPVRRAAGSAAAAVALPPYSVTVVRE